MRVAGIMSGTSLDGIDVAMVDIRGSKVQTVVHGTVPWRRGLREKILAVSNAQCHTRDISRLNFELGAAYADAVIRVCKPLRSLQLVGCHGQTIYHEGGGRTPNTMQIGEASVIAERLGLPVVSDFRTRDVAAGGQGAPLVPFADYLLFGRGKGNRVALNIGGIANITVLRDGTAFDTGPGNMVVDQLTQRLTGGKERFDRGGRIAAGGRVDRPLLGELMKDPWLRLPPPRSAGREQYGTGFIERLIGTKLPLQDLIGTATAFTAASIAFAVEQFAPGTEQIIAAGGGVLNRQLMGQLAAFLPACRVVTSAQYGVDPGAKEAIAFAVLAHRTWQKKTGNLPSATGAKRAVILGKISY